MVTSSGSGTPPKELILLLLPRNLHTVYRIELQVDCIPAIRISRCAAVIIMTWDLDIQEAFRSCWAEDRIQSRYRPPVREEVALVIVLVRSGTEIYGRCGGGGDKSKIGAGVVDGGREVVHVVTGERVTDGGKKTPRGGVGRAGTTPGVPDVSFVRPVRTKRAMKDCFDSACWKCLVTESSTQYIFPYQKSLELSD